MSDVLEEYGPHDWLNYVHYWREQDAEWLQARSILRVPTPAAIPTEITTPGIGQVVHVKDVSATVKDILYIYNTAAKWVPYGPMPKFLAASEDTASRVTLGHHTGNFTALPTLTFSPSGLDVIANFSVRTSVLKVTATNIQMKTGTKNVILTTDAANLVSDSPIKAPSLISTGGISVTGTVTAGSVTAASLTASGAISGATVAATGAITAGTTVTAGTGDANGLRTGGARYLGNASGAVIRGANWVAGRAQFLVYTDYAQFDGANVYMDSQFIVRNARSIIYTKADNVAVMGYGGPVVYSTAEPVGAPNGTIWVKP